MTRLTSPRSIARNVLGCAALVLLAALPSAADFMVVDSTADVPDRNLAELACWTGAACTLRAAIQTANASPGADTIILPAGVYTITIPGTGEDAGSTGDFDIWTDLTIIGCGMNGDCDPSTTVVQAGTVAKEGPDRVFHIAADVNVTFSGITIRNGTATYPDAKGGGVKFAPPTGGSLTLDNTLVEENKVFPGYYYAAQSGAGIYATSGAGGAAATTLVVKNSTIRNNDVVQGEGGGICVENVTATVVDSTFTGNVSDDGAAAFSAIGAATNAVVDRCLVTGNHAIDRGDSRGMVAGLYNSRGSLTVSNSTISGNTSVQPYGTTALYHDTSFPGIVTLRNVTMRGVIPLWCSSGSTTVAHNSIIHGYVFNSLAASSSNNIVWGSSAGLTNGVNGNQIGVNPQLSELEVRGGRSAAHYPLAGSPALDAGNNAEATTHDQRGFQRITDSADADAVATVDIGAVEVFPTISDLTDQTVAIGTTVELPFRVGDAALGVGITATSGNTATVPNENLLLTDGTSSNPTLWVTPTAAGTATITVVANSFGLTASDTFQVTARPTLAIGDVTADEGDAGTTTFTFTVSLSSGAPAGGVTFDIATADGSAIAPGDYTASSANGVTIAEGATSAVFDVLVVGDSAVEDDEAFDVSITNVTGAIPSDAAAVGTITNDDTVPPPVPPTGVIASAITATSVGVTWDPVADATGYELYRSSGGGWGLVGSPAGTSFTDTTASAGVAYLYRVRATNEGGDSLDSGADLATTVIFTDPVLTVGTTIAKAAHVTELRVAVDAVTQLAGLTPVTYTDAALAAGTTIAKTAHVTELRAALDAARLALGLAQVSYTDPAITSGATPIKAAHVVDLRGGVR